MHWMCQWPFVKNILSASVTAYQAISAMHSMQGSGPGPSHADAQIGIPTNLHLWSQGSAVKTHAAVTPSFSELGLCQGLLKAALRHQCSSGKRGPERALLRGEANCKARGTRKALCTGSEASTKFGHSGLSTLQALRDSKWGYR